MKRIKKSGTRVRVTVQEKAPGEKRSKAKCLTFCDTTGDEVFEAIERLPELADAKPEPEKKSV